MNALASLCYDRVGHDHEAAEAEREAMLTNPQFGLAFGLLAEGFSIIPLYSDSKRPAVKWKEFQTRYATLAELAEWFIDNDYDVAIVTGKLSGITIVDCDSIDAIDALLDSGIESRMTQLTRRGMHFVFRFAGERNTVRMNGWKGVDRRGEGGFVRAYAEAGDWTHEDVLGAEYLR